MADVPAVVAVLFGKVVLLVGSVDTVELELGGGSSRTSIASSILEQSRGVKNGAVGAVDEFVG